MAQDNPKREEVTPKVIIVVSLIIIVVCFCMLFLFKGLLSIGATETELENQSIIETPKHEKITPSH